MAGILSNAAWQPQRTRHVARGPLSGAYFARPVFLATFTHTPLAPATLFFGDESCPLNLPLKQTKINGDQQLEQDTSIEKLLQCLEGREFQVEDELVAISISTEASSLRLHGPTFNCKLAGAILELQKEGIKPLASEWFLYDTDESDTDPAVRYSFLWSVKTKLSAKKLQ